ncbi:MAG TPA: biotin/lipoyl-binding protein [Tissierellia bacterium]|jgi:biotin carboxyl carrier protein|nr:biotin/lipoyl-binding protein [Tissierellia bacterium]
MKQFNITVNGKVYEVVVEEVGAVTAPRAAAPAPAPVAAAPAPAAPAAAPAAPAPAAPAAAPTGKTVSSPMPGTILDIRVKAGDSVKNGDVLVILEAMKMENEIMADGDGVVANILTTVGASVNSGDALIEFQ